MSILEEINKTNVLHIKIPKNGTHSINKVLSKDSWNRTNFIDQKTNQKYIFDHDTLVTLEKNNILDDNVFIFCICRNPYTRFFSQFNHLIRSYPNYCKKNINDFVEDIKSERLHPLYTETQTKWVSESKKSKINSIDLIYDKILNVFLNSNGIENFNNITNQTISNKIDKIYKIENIENFEKDFNVKLTYNNYSNYSLVQYKNSFNKKIKDFVAKYYEEDFENFGYDFDFEQSIIGLKMQRKKLLYYQ